MSPHTLETFGRLLFGRSWQTDLAAAMGVDRQTVIGWRTGKWTMPPGRVRDIRLLAQVHAENLRGALAL